MPEYEDILSFLEGKSAGGATGSPPQFFMLKRFA
jgi:hypothetical protein